jgi:hypothetical protein
VIDDESIQDAREWLDAMNKVVQQCDRDLLAAFRAGVAYASEDDAPEFYEWLINRRSDER